MSKLSECVQRIKPSPTLAVTAKAAQLRAEGKDIIGLGAGEPDFDTPIPIKEAAIEAINSGFTKYTAVGGTPSLKKAVVDKFKRENNLDYTIQEVTVSAGGKHTFFNMAMAVLDPGDEVIIPAPYWVSYPDMVLIPGATPVIVETGIEQGFKLTPDQLRAALTDKTRMLVLNSPSNPTGAVYTLDELKALGDVLKDYPNVLVVTDDMYEHINLTGVPFVNILNACPELKSRTMVLNGVSKAYAMTGWRIGYAAGSADIIKAMEKIQSQSTSNPTSISQVAAEAALNGDKSYMKPMLDAFKARHAFVYKRFSEIPGLHCAPAGGAFYLFPDAREVIDNLMKQGKIKEATDVALADYLLENAGVAVVPGSAFGAPGYFRISFATSMENLEKATDRIEKALS